MKRVAAILLAALMPIGTAKAALVYEFPSYSRAPTQTVANATASDIAGWDICVDSIGNPAPSCGVFFIFNNTMSFSISADVGYSLDITGFQFDEMNPGEFGPTGFGVFTSTDNFASAILTGSLTSGAVSFSTHSTALSLNDVVGPFEVRIVASGNSGTSSTAWYMDNITLNVTASPREQTVPAPATLALLGIGLTGLGIARRRKAH